MGRWKSVRCHHHRRKGRRRSSKWHPESRKGSVLDLPRSEVTAFEFTVHPAISLTDWTPPLPPGSRPRTPPETPQNGRRASGGGVRVGWGVAAPCRACEGPQIAREPRPSNFADDCKLPAIHSLTDVDWPPTARVTLRRLHWPWARTRGAVATTLCTAHRTVRSGRR